MRASRSSPRPITLGQDLLGAENEGNGSASPLQTINLNPTLGLPQADAPGLDTSTSLERLIQRVEAYKDEVQAYKDQIREQERKHDLEIKTQNENHERVLAMAKKHARVADENKAQLANFQWDMSQIQEDNTALRVEVRKYTADNHVMIIIDNFVFVCPLFSEL